MEGNKFSYLETEIITKDKKKYHLGVSIKGKENFTEGCWDEKSTVPIALQNQIIYRTSISLFKRHIPLLGLDFKKNSYLFQKNGYAQVSDLLTNTYHLYYLKNPSRNLSEFERAQKILSRLSEATAYLENLSKDVEIKVIRERISRGKGERTSLQKARALFKEVLEFYEIQLKTKGSIKRRNPLDILKKGGVRKNIEMRLGKYWKLAKLPHTKIKSIIDTLAKFNQDEEKAIKEVRKRFRYFRAEERKNNYLGLLKEFRKKKVKNLSKRLIGNIKGETLADIGGRREDLVEEIIRLNGNLKKVYVTDVGLFTKTSKNPKIQFVIQPSLNQIPLKENSIDTAILSMVLHHIKKTSQKKILKSLSRILKPGGRIILIEDSYPFSLKDFLLWVRVAENFPSILLNKSNIGGT